MAESGSDVAFAVTVRAEPTVVAQMLTQALQSGGNYLEDTQVVPVGPTSFRITRKYMPQWAIIVGIIGLLLCLIGIVAFFIRDTEVLTIDIQPDGDGSRVVVSGKATAAIVSTIQGVLARFEGYAPASIGPEASALGPAGAAPSSPGMSTDSPNMSPDRAYWWDGTGWQDASASVPPGAQRSPDGQSWWDGVEWRPVRSPDEPGGNGAGG